MKISYLLIGLVIGGILGFTTAKFMVSENATANPADQEELVMPSTKNEANWNWADSLDALKAAPESHKIVYEDSSVRILQVILEANQTEPMHVHEWKSVMWFTHATPMTYYKYNVKGDNFIIEDSIPIPQMPQEVLNHGDLMDAEGPHAIKNSSDQQGLAYRVEFKK
ncbi:hypothetical protein [Fulvivirga ligni]|uniref:hypothetical protein n=1 Tax=Fulvivirga ligni TaxID=2904246 RepID=UPI001F1FCD00|nr:hypothetical protein [Fulvivirga ligni]UII21302.1 hypothetical protein LVD16_26070 [Fulvivirga ligni]